MRIILIVMLVMAVSITAGPREEELFDAIRGNNIHRVKDMVEAGADLTTRNRDNETPLMAAIREDHEEIIFYLVKAGSEDPFCEYNEHVIRRKLMARKDMCFGNMQKLLEAIELYQLEVYWKDKIKDMCLIEKLSSKLMPYLYDSKFPQCPELGKYVYDPDKDCMFCTKHGTLKRHDFK